LLKTYDVVTQCVNNSERLNMTAWRNHRGASAVEFALVLPILMVLLFGIIEFGLLMYNKAVITNASREGARAGIVFSPRPDVSAIEQVVRNYADAHVVSFPKGATDPDVPSGACTAFGNDLIVDVSYPHNFLVFSGLVSLLGSGGPGTMPGTVTLNARTVMRCE
jgi:Flp pilus assembly protein TadG